MATDTALHLAETIIAEGFDSLDAELEALLVDARQADVNSVLVDVAGDRSAPTPVRERALGRVVVELSRTAPRAPLPHWVTSGVRRRIAA